MKTVYFFSCYALTFSIAARIIFTILEMGFKFAIIAGKMESKVFLNGY